MGIKAWTDYPFPVLGDGAVGAIRECEILAWDRNKYARIRIGVMSFTIKAGYCYVARGRHGEVEPVPKSELDKLPKMW